MSMSFAVAALAGLTANAMFKKLHLINVRAGLIAPITRACAAIELMLCVRVMTQEVFLP